MYICKLMTKELGCTSAYMAILKAITLLSVWKFRKDRHAHSHTLYMYSRSVNHLTENNVPYMAKAILPPALCTQWPGK